MTKISEKEFAKLCLGIKEDRETIIKHNPIGTEEETLLWMLASVLHSFLSLKENETPCFPGTPTADVYRDAIHFIVKDRKSDDFDEAKYLKELVAVN